MSNRFVLCSSHVLVYWVKLDHGGETKGFLHPRSFRGGSTERRAGPSNARQPTGEMRDGDDGGCLLIAGSNRPAALN
jgi:hypothetical protein